MPRDGALPPPTGDVGTTVVNAVDVGIVKRPQCDPPGCSVYDGYRDNELQEWAKGGTDGGACAYAMQADVRDADRFTVNLIDVDCDTGAHWSRSRKEGQTNEDRWTAPWGLVADIGRLTSPTGMAEHRWDVSPTAMTEPSRVCVMCAVGINQDAAVIVCRVTRAGVMADSGANACMDDSEVNFVNCHNIRPVTMGLAIASESTPVIHVCRCMGYMLMTREDGRVHRQLFLVNTQATNCIMSPDAIAQQVLDCVSWKQEGHVGDTPGSLSFYDVHVQRILHLRLGKRSELCYYDSTDGTKTDGGDMYNRFTED